MATAKKSRGPKVKRPKYRPVSQKLWDDRKFLELSQDGRYLWMFLLTCPTRPIPGVMLAGDAAIAEQLGWTTERLRERFVELATVGLHVRREGRVLWLPNALNHEPPSNPNAIRSWAAFWDDVPDGRIKEDLYQALKIACKSWSALFAQLFNAPRINGSGNGSVADDTNGSSNGCTHEHEHEHEHEQVELASASSSRAPAIQLTPAAFDEQALLTVAQMRPVARVAAATWERFRLRRDEVAKKLGVEYVPMPPYSEDHAAKTRDFNRLCARLLALGANAEATAAYVLDRLTEQALKPGAESLAWLGVMAFTSGGWRRAQETPAPRKRPANDTEDADYPMPSSPLWPESPAEGAA